MFSRDVNVFIRISALNKMRDNNTLMGLTVGMCSMELLGIRVVEIPTLNYGLIITLRGQPNTLAKCLILFESAMKAD